MAVARALVPEGPGRPGQAQLRRAVSTGYYAVFHVLTRNAADMLAGRGGYARGEAAWFRVNRAVEHGFAASQCGKDSRSRRVLRSFPPDIRAFAKIFVDLQTRRHLADYALDQRFEKAAVLNDLRKAERAVRLIENAPDRDRRAFAAHVLFRERR